MDFYQILSREILLEMVFMELKELHLIMLI